MGRSWVLGRTSTPLLPNYKGWEGRLGRPPRTSHPHFGRTLMVIKVLVLACMGVVGLIAKVMSTVVSNDVDRNAKRICLWLLPRASFIVHWYERERWIEEWSEQLDSCPEEGVSPFAFLLGIIGHALPGVAVESWIRACGGWFRLWAFVLFWAPWFAFVCEVAVAIELQSALRGMVVFAAVDGVFTAVYWPWIRRAAVKVWCGRSSFVWVMRFIVLDVACLLVWGIVDHLSPYGWEHLLALGLFYLPTVQMVAGDPACIHDVPLMIGKTPAQILAERDTAGE